MGPTAEVPAGSKQPTEYAPHAEASFTTKIDTPGGLGHYPKNDCFCIRSDPVSEALQVVHRTSPFCGSHPRSNPGPEQVPMVRVISMTDFGKFNKYQ